MEVNKPETVAEKQEMITVHSEGGRFRWVAVAALLLAIGSIMRLVSPSFAGVTPNWIITMYCLSILIINPSISRAVAIGLVAGAIATATSKSPMPHINILSEAIGALVCVLVARIPLLQEIGFGPLSLRPAVVALLSTIASGMCFVTVLKIVTAAPMQVYLYGMIPVVLFTAAANTVLTQILYYPAQKLLGNGQVK